MKIMFTGIIDTEDFEFLPDGLQIVEVVVTCIDHELERSMSPIDFAENLCIQWDILED